MAPLQNFTVTVTSSFAPTLSFSLRLLSFYLYFINIFPFILQSRSRITHSKKEKKQKSRNKIKINYTPFLAMRLLRSLFRLFKKTRYWEKKTQNIKSLEEMFSTQWSCFHSNFKGKDCKFAEITVCNRKIRGKNLNNNNICNKLFYIVWRGRKTKESSFFCIMVMVIPSWFLSAVVTSQSCHCLNVGSNHSLCILEYFALTKDK